MSVTGRFWTGQIGDFYLSQDGTAGTQRWKLKVKGGAAFLDAEAAVNATPAADGSTIYQAVIVDYAGFPFEIEIPHFHKTQLATLVEMLTPTRRPTGDPVRVILDSPFIRIDVMARADGGIDWISVGEFSDPILDDVVIRFNSTGPGA